MHFTVMGDLHAEQRPEKTEQNLRSMQCDNACFATLLGDLTTDGSRASHEKFLLPILNKYRPAKLMSCFGNHDKLDTWSAIFGQNKYYSWHWADYSFLWLYNANERPLEEDTQQWQWLKEELKNSNKNIFCFAHCPPNIVPRWQFHSFRAEETHRLLSMHNVYAFFAGHIHAFDYEFVDGIKYVLTGGGGGNPYNLNGQNYKGTNPHYIHVLIGEKIDCWRVVNRNGIFCEKKF